MNRYTVYALVFGVFIAMCGAVTAASSKPNYKITSTNQIKPEVRKSLRGATGPTGERGPAGSQGIAGPAGAKGDAGSQGAAGDRGPQGDVGPQGPKGSTGITNITVVNVAVAVPNVNGSVLAIASCPEGARATGGGHTTFPGIDPIASGPANAQDFALNGETPTAWRVIFHNSAGPAGVEMRAYAVCATS